MATTPTFTWSVTAGGDGGTVSSSGLYTAPATNGTDTVNAASGGVTGSKVITVTAT